MAGVDLLIVAWDGAPYEGVRRWLAEGALPSLRELLGGDRVHPLYSTIPPITAAAWASFHTGTDPGAHGIFDFARQRPGGLPRLVSAADIPYPTFWELASREVPVGFLGFPLGYPARRLERGFWVPGFLAPRGAASFPQEALAIAHRAAGGYRFNPPVWSPGRRWVQELISTLEGKTAAAIALARRYRPSLLGVHFQVTDTVQHFLWGDDAVEELFSAADRALGELVAALSPNDVLILSDHGMGPVRWDFHVNTWLLHMGYLRPCRRVATRLRRALFRVGFVPKALQRPAERLSTVLAPLARGAGMATFWRRSLPGTGVFLSLADVDWERSTVYSPGGMGGLSRVAPGRPSLEEIAGALRELRAPDGGPAVEAVLPVSELYPHATDGAPELIFLTRGMEILPVSHYFFLSHRAFTCPSVPAHHRLRGILAGTSPELVGDDLSIWELAPRILGYFGLEAPGYMRGPSLQGLLERAKLASGSHAR